MDLILFDTPLGRMGLAEEEGAIIRLYLPGEGVPLLLDRETSLLAKAKGQLMEYFAGGRKCFDLPLNHCGTPFRETVWRALTEIPYGRTITYGQLAANIGKPKAVRAVGGANHHNPIPIIIPCHRVIGSDGSLTGYGGGVELKEKLLELERSHL